MSCLTASVFIMGEFCPDSVGTESISPRTMGLKIPGDSYTSLSLSLRAFSSKLLLSSSY